MNTHTPEQLAAILAAHADWLRGESGGTRADLRGADLTRADLRGADLTRADLTGADLRGADLTGADLRGADLTGADLRGADLTRADLTGADLRGAVLTDGVAMFKVPGLHQKMLAAIEAKPEAFDMSTWHRDGVCGTTHCRAGWAVVLAGDAGKALEWVVGSSTAGALITHASCPWLGKVPNFHASNEEALADIRACAAKEAELEAAGTVQP